MAHSDVEMNRIIAEKCMGWHRGIDCWISAQGEQKTATLAGWTPTTDAAQAVQALEVMRARGHDIRLGSMARPGTEWWAWLSKYDEGVSFYDASLPRAICLALVEAVR
jgi:hypothetical protein